MMHCLVDKSPKTVFTCYITECNSEKALHDYTGLNGLLIYFGYQENQFS